MLYKYVLLSFFLCMPWGNAISQFIVLENREEVQLPANAINEENPELHLLRYYSSIGYLSVKIDSTKAQKIWITKGCLYQIKEFTYSELTHPNEITSFKFTGNYSKVSIEKEIERVRNEFAQQGYIKTEAEIVAFTPDSKTCTVSIQVQYHKGELYYSTGIHFSGAIQNSQAHLSKLARYRDSTLVSSANTKRIRQELLGTGLFEQVSQAEFFEKDESVFLVYAVRERPLNTFDGILGYAPDATGQGQVVGSVKATLGNVFSQGNVLGFNYERLRPETSRLKIDASQSWLGNVPIGLGIGFSIFQNDTTYQTRKFGVNMFYWLAPGFKINTGIQSTVSNSSKDFGFELEPDGKKQSLNLGFNYSTLNNYDLPTSGYLLDVDFSVSNKDIEGDSLLAFKQQAIETRLEGYQALSDKSVLMGSFNTFFVIGNRFTESDLIRFGGANSFRGYAEEQFMASKLTWANLEYRFLVNPSSYLFTFGSSGYYERPKLVNEAGNLFKQKSFIYSTGFGISYKTKIGRLSFTYAISPQESIANGKVHFGIVTSL